MAWRPQAPLAALLTGFSAVCMLAPGARSEPAPRREVTIAATGDILFHGRVVAGAREHGGGAGLGRALAGLAAAIEPEDLAVANLEVPLTTEVVPLAGGRLPILGAPAELAQALSSAGVDAVSVANNHAYDQGTKGIALTLAALRRSGIAAAGAGPTPEAARRGVVVDRGGLRVALLAFTAPVNRLPRRRGDEDHHVARMTPEADVLHAISEARRSADVVVVSAHWSRDFVETPTRAQQGLARRMVDAGADVILGTGPHLLQRVERVPSPRGEAVVAYSLGNLISPQGYQVSYGRHREGHRAAVHPGSRDGAVLRVTLQVSGGRLTVGSLTAAPLWTRHDHRGPGHAPDIRVVPMSEAPEGVRRRRLQAIRRALGPEVELLATRPGSPP